MKPEVLPVRVGFILIDAYREEAQLYRESGKETRARHLEQAADKMEFLSNAPRS